MPITVHTIDPDDPLARHCLSQYFTLLGTRIPGLPLEKFPLPDPQAHEYRPPHGTFLLASQGQTPQGCVSLRPFGPSIAEVKRLWIAPTARGQGLARRLMTAIEDQARTLGYTSLQLDTNAHLPEAIALYTKTGWTPIPAYSPPPATHWFAKAM